MRLPREDFKFEISLKVLIFGVVKVGYKYEETDKLWQVFISIQYDIFIRKAKNMKIFFTCCFIFCASLSFASGENNLLKDYKGDVILPADLYQTYLGLVTAFQTGKREEIEKFCVPAQIKITFKSRPKNNQEYGQDINIPLLKRGFDKFILNLRKDSELEYLIRTGTTSLWFSKNKEGKWQLSKYLDKPMY